MLPGAKEPFPSRDAIVKESRHSADVFTKWNEQSLLQRVDRTAYRVSSSVRLDDPPVSASDAGTIVPDAVGGTYRITATREVIAADPVNSSLAITIGWTHNGKALTRALSAFAGAPQTISDTVGDQQPIEVDAGTPISYTLTYASNTPGVAQFAVTLIAELLEAEAD